MAGDGDEYRAVIACTSCGKPYAAEEVTDGDLRPIGGRTECSCGETDFVEVDSEAVFDED